MAPTTGHRVAPGAAAVYFALLVGAVLATSVVVFFSVALSPSIRMEAVQARLAECAATLDADAARLAAEGTLDAPGQREALTADFRSCLRPAYAAPLTAVAAGLGLLTVVALTLYLAHPWWIVRRDRSTRLTPDLVPGLAHDLARLSRDLGLARAPEWRLVPHRGAPSGQAFGLPGRRRIHLGAGLLVLRATDRPAFRAVVAHELAHLRNRDVDLTYLTISIWRAFLFVAVLPPLLVLLLFTTSRGWTWRSPVDALAGNARLLGAMLALTCLVYLLRNSVLRARETYADAVAASVGGTGAALSAILQRQPAPRRWLARWGTHPRPHDRLRAIRGPATTLTSTHWDLVAAGLPSGVLTANLVAVAGGALGLDPVLGTALLALVVGSVLAALLALTVWRAARGTTVGTGQSRRVPFWFTSGTVLAGSFMAGTQVSVVAVTGTPGSIGGSGLASTLVAGLLLTVAAVVLAAWADSTSRATWLHATAHLADPSVEAAASDASVAGANPRAASVGPGRPARWALAATLAAAGLAGAAALAVWLPFSTVRFGFAIDWGPPPADGAGWYATVGRLSTADLGPAYRFVYNPLTLLALTALWLVPATLAGRAGRGTILWRSGLVGLGGGAVVAVVGAVLPVAAGVVVPVGVRQAVPEPDEISFGAVVDNSTIAVGSLVVAIAMAVVVAGRGPLRPARALLAATVATAAATAAIWWVAGPVRCLTGVGLCREAVDLDAMSRTALWILVQGLLVAVPLVLAAAVAGARRRAPGGPTPPATTGGDPPTAPATTGSDAPAGHRRTGTARVVALLVLLAVITTLVWGIRTSAYETWLRGTFG
ncbi:M48 family metalloprotease [Micromonospora sp. WMMD558]|uniref:M48 family metalloprotease n=1 Tax=unclassified Micromonospora TaxID=2617518 RepID=UPI0012B47881|nr:M48 family metalloprotease [Micromonospora sp. WMMC415]QGN48697.1 M48 family metalloprotease [Micromonospora sp. WMMC415]